MTNATAFHAGSLALAVFVCVVQARAEEPPAKAVELLKGLGLSPQKTRYVLAEDEDALRKKYREAVEAVDDAREAMDKVEEGAMFEQGIAALQADEEALRNEIGAMRSAGNRMGGGRRRGGRYSRGQPNAAVRQDEAALGQVRAKLKAAAKQKPSTKEKQAAEAGSKQAAERARSAAREVVSAYEALLQRYEEAHANPGLVQALEDVGRPNKVVFGLGPSDDCEKIGKWAASIAKVRIQKPSAAAKPGTATTGGRGARP